MRKTTGFFLVLFLFLSFWGTKPVWAVPQIAGKSAVLIDAKSGQVLYDLAKDEKLQPASTTKILTTIIAIESGKLDDVVTVGPNPPKVDGTRVYLVEGEKVKLRDLVKAALIQSANDAALAIAEYLSGSQEEFAKVMNAKAQAIGAVNSHFVSPHGLSDENHYTTAYDLSLIARYAMKNDTFREIVKTKTLDWQGQAWQTRLININKMLWNYDGADGVKTGYTTEAKSTIVASATRDGQTLIAVILGDSGQAVYEDASNLLDYGFTNYQQLELATPGVVAATVNIDGNTKLQLVPGESFSISLPAQGDKQVESRLDLKPLPKKITKGQVVGQMVFSVGGKEIGRIDLLAKNAVVTSHIKITTILIYGGAWLFFLQLLIKMSLFYRRRRKRNSFGFSEAYTRSYRA